MAVSTTLFGVYFKIMEMHAKNASSVLPVTAMPDSTGEQLAWLPLASMALFISGEYSPIKASSVRVLDNLPV